MRIVIKVTLRRNKDIFPILPSLVVNKIKATDDGKACFKKWIFNIMIQYISGMPNIGSLVGSI